MGSGTTTYTYDQLGQLTSRVNTAGGGTISYGYNTSYELISTTDARGTTTYDYDASGVVTQVNFMQPDPLLSQTGVLGFATDDHGRRTDEWLQTNADHTLWWRTVHRMSSHASLRMTMTVVRLLIDNDLAGDPDAASSPRLSCESVWFAPAAL